MATFEVSGTSASVFSWSAAWDDQEGFVVEDRNGHDRLTRET